MSMLCTNNYEEISARLLDLSPALVTVAMPLKAPVKHTTIHKQLIELNEIHNTLLLLIAGELLHWHLNIKIPSPTTLPSVCTFSEFVTERDRLFDAISKYDDLYLHLVHVRKSYEEDWVYKKMLNYIKNPLRTRE
ncbi:hypothetical protein ACTOV9_00855 [Legionella pneumophila]|uniref:Uncharacterized protein n=1 Tax=Legionella pneumophila TaxID=446 RepID=A0A2S6F9I6_LEGPN|nr:hypothetical protein [Legionella pneumophila]APF01977.1 hypothetical protein BIZ52_00745 [Legionella pneumophila subsp. fraseri]APF04988.1 hypothetical protein BIZ51_00745 [Legionella pneumophila subsp. fraseri]AUB67460.1 hypothetical protein BJK09_00750 [Legionella pneumophila]AUB70433.1 hypothetical protein BJK08_00750 [Legionella pneumophila]KXB22891.1 hypothetical protein PtVF66_15490 [Legionella pneumophila]